MTILYKHILYLYIAYIKKQIPYIYILLKIPTAYPKSINIHTVSLCTTNLLKGYIPTYFIFIYIIPI